MIEKRLCNGISYLFRFLNRYVLNVKPMHGNVRFSLATDFRKSHENISR